VDEMVVDVADPEMVVDVVVQEATIATIALLVILTVEVVAVAVERANATSASVLDISNVIVRKEIDATGVTELDILHEIARNLMSPRATTVVNQGISHVIVRMVVPMVVVGTLDLT